MVNPNRRQLMMLGGLSAVAATAMVGGALPAAAQEGKPVVGLRYQNFKRGTINSLDPPTRGLTIVWEDLGRVKLKAADLVTNYGANPGQSAGASTGLKEGQVVDVQWYDYVDFLVAKKTPENMAKAKAMIAQGAKIEGIPGAQQPIRLWEMDGMCTKVDPATNTVFLINPSGGEPDKPAPNSGEVIQMPQIVTPAGKAALQTVKPGEEIVTVYSVQTAIKVTIIR